MTKKNIILAVLSSAKDARFSPVQIQKLFFLVDKRLGNKIGGPFFQFKPYHYGPFDKGIYEELNKLRNLGYIDSTSVNRKGVKTYFLTDAGIEKGEAQLQKFGRKETSFMKRLADYVLSLSFTELITAIYKAYPEMKVNSIYED